MKLRKDLLQGIERFLNLVPAQTRKRGRAYHARGQVLELECLQPDQSYTAIVRGSEDHEVSLRFADKVWSSDCTCPMQYDCKHAVAAMLELQQRASAAAAKGKIAAAAKLRWQNHKLPRRVPQPPRSPLYDRLVAHLGRELDQAEAGVIRNVQALHANAGFRQLTESDLGQVSQGRSFYAWQPLELWPGFPRD